MSIRDPQSPLLKKYEKAYRGNPNSRVFAPLAESYRKLGMIDKAIETLKKGLKSNPDYVLGHQCLGACYFDQGEFEKTFSVIHKYIDKNRDNIRLQKLYAETCRKIGKLELALETYKFLLFINPKDEEVAAFVSALENEEIVPIMGRSFDTDGDANQKDSDDVDDWSQVSFSDKHNEKNTLAYEKVDIPSDDEWTMNDGFKLDANEAERKFVIADSNEVGNENAEISENKSPVMTLTLVDLYLSQGHINKAKEILEKLIELNPTSVEVKEKLQEINEILELSTEVSSLKIDSAETGYTDLMSLYDQKVGESDFANTNQEQVEKRLFSFLDGLKERAKQQQCL